MLQIIYNRSWETPSLLANALHNVQVGHDKNLILRWGVSGGDNNNPNNVILNPGSALAACSNKYEELRIIASKNDAKIHVPRIYRNRDEIDQFPVVGRPFNHKKGLSFWMLRNQRDIDEMIRRGRRGTTRKQVAQYFMQFVPAVEEYRVHVFYDGVNRRKFRVIRINKKVRTHTNMGKFNVSIVKNHRNGWTFDFMEANDPSLANIRLLARRCIKYLGLHFGACDIGVTREGVAYVYEVNTAPGLDAGGIERYTNFIANQYTNLNQWRPPINGQDND